MKVLTIDEMYVVHGGTTSTILDKTLQKGAECAVAFGAFGLLFWGMGMIHAIRDTPNLLNVIIADPADTLKLSCFFVSGMALAGACVGGILGFAEGSLEEVIG